MPVQRGDEQRIALTPGVWSTERLVTADDGTVATVTITGAADFRLSARDGRLVVQLVLAGTTRPIDVSIQPVLLPSILAEHPTSTDRTAGELAQLRADHHRRLGLWSPRPERPADLLTVIGGACFPLLGACYDDDAVPLAQIPRWAAPALRQPTAHAGAAVAFPRARSRRLVKSFARSLRPTAGHEPPNLYPLALALMGAPALDADRLANLLRAAEGQPVAMEHWPDCEQVRTACRLFADVAGDRVERLLTDAATAPDGPALLAHTLTLWHVARRDLRGAVPTRLERLQEHCLAQLPADPRPELARRQPLPPPRAAPHHRRSRSTPNRPAAAPPGAAQAPRPARAEPRPASPRAEPPPPLAYLAQRAPVATGGPVTAATTLPTPPVLRSARGQELGDLRLLVPRTVAELVDWGRRLSNCLGDFAPAVASGRSLLIGVQHHDRLVACVELDPDGRVRQFLGRANRRPNPRQAAQVVDHLLAIGAIDGAHPSNWPLLEQLGLLSHPANTLTSFP